jgi:hypothetical protein
MGAFGELLIKTWGGDLDRYRGNYETKSTTKAVETTEEDKERSMYNRKIDLARNRLDLLTTNIMYNPQDINDYTEESMKGGFKQLGYDENIQNIMWNEYMEFVSKYVVK